MTVTHLHSTAAHPRDQGRNGEHTALLLAALAGVLALAFTLMWGVLGLVGAIASIGGLYYTSPRVPVEAVMRLYRARPVEARPGNRLSAIVAELAQRAGLPRSPKLHVIPSLALNAFAVGSPEHSAIAVTEGVLRQLGPREIAGVLAHEISHIRNDDLRVLGLADIVTRLVVILAQVALVLALFNLIALLAGDDPIAPWPAVFVFYFGPAVTSLLQLALARTREFVADFEAARLTGDPLALASALERLDDSSGRLVEDLNWPVPVRRVAAPSLLRTHPLLAERIARLRSMPRGIETPELAEAPMMTLVGFGPGDMRPRVRWPGVWF